MRLVERAPKGSWRPTELARALGAGLEGVERACKIANMAEELLVLAPKVGPLVHFSLNDGQGIILDFIADRWARGLPVYALIPKARQVGVSTFVQAFLFVLCLVHERKGKPYRCATVAHIEDSARSIFSMTRLFERKLPKTWRLPLESNQQGRIEWSGGSRNQVVSAKLGDAALKGVTLNGFHGSEVANWADLGMDPNQLWSSAWGAIAKDRDAFVVLESTAKGRDPFFHGMVERSRANRFEFPVVFIPWFLMPEYRMDWSAYRASRPTWKLAEHFEPTTDEILFREFLANRTVRPGDEWCVFRHELTDEQLIWRRAQIETLGRDVSEGLERFKRYFPATLEECWAANEHSFLGERQNEILDRMARQRRTPQRGSLSETLEWKASVRPDAIMRWQAPIPGHHYVIGADCSEAVTAGDFQAAYCVDRDTHEVVAALHCKMDPDEFGLALERLGRYYNVATLAIENNATSTVVSSVQKRNYPRLYWHKNPDQVRGRPPRPGFNTNKRTRPVLIAVLSAVLRDDDLAFNDEGFFAECGTFVWSERRQTYAAPKGFHDDRILALAIAVYVCDWREDDGRRHARASAAPVIEDRGVLAWRREQAQAKRRARERAGPGPRCQL